MPNMYQFFVIQPTQFVDLPSGELSLGVRIYDGFTQNYDNTWDSIPDDDFEILKLCLKNEQFEDLFNCLRESESGIYIGKEWYCWSDIKEIVKNHFIGNIRYDNYI